VFVIKKKTSVNFLTAKRFTKGIIKKNEEKSGEKLI